jgi:hypothetical protein
MLAVAAVKPDLSAVVDQCGTQEGARSLVDAIEKRLRRPPAALQRLREALDRWNAPVIVDDAVRELLEAIDPVVEVGGYSVKSMLEAMREATSRRAAAHRRTHTTQKRRIR